MTSEQFAYWLQGFVELNGSEPTPEQWQSIKDHLKTVFVKVTPEVRQIGPSIPSFPGIRTGDIAWPQWAEPKITCSVYSEQDRNPLFDGTLSGAIVERLVRKTPRYQ